MRDIEYYVAKNEELLRTVESLEAKLAVAIQTMKASKNWLSLGCLELTAHMGIPEKKREAMIRNIIINYNFLIEEQLQKIEKL